MLSFLLHCVQILYGRSALTQWFLVILIGLYVAILIYWYLLLTLYCDFASINDGMKMIASFVWLQYLLFSNWDFQLGSLNLHEKAITIYSIFYIFPHCTHCVSNRSEYIEKVLCESQYKHRWNLLHMPKLNWKKYLILVLMWTLHHSWLIWWLFHSFCCH